jgi:stearoyl-CoA desaturase (delta-9 desaturase)
MHAPAHGHDHFSHPVALRNRLLTMFFVFAPPAVLGFAVWYCWGTGVRPVDLVMLVVGYMLTAMGITIGYHRYFTHKSFHAARPVIWFFAGCGSAAVQGPVLWWCTTHRRHHQHSDDHLDPHSPHAGREAGAVGWIRGFLHSHLGWLYTRPMETSVERYAPDIAADRDAQLISALFPVFVLLGFLIPAGIGWLASGTWEGAFLGFLWGGVIRMLAVHHATWSVNSVCHLFGSQTYRSGDESRNNLPMGILAMGEGWHNNHHAFPASARHGLEWWQFDISWITIRSLAAVGLVTNIRLPSRERMAEKRIDAQRLAA